MTTTVRIAATTAADVYTASIASGAAAHFKATGLGNGESVVVKVKDGSGNYEALSYLDGDGRPRKAYMDSTANSIRITGPLDIQLSKDVTGGNVEVVEYT